MGDFWSPCPFPAAKSVIQVPAGALGSKLEPQNTCPSTEETDVPELGCRCCWLVTDGILIRLLLGSLIKVMCGRKFGGGPGGPFPLGQESCEYRTGGSRVMGGPSHHELSWKLSFGTSQVPRLGEVGRREGERNLGVFALAWG